MKTGLFFSRLTLQRKAPQVAPILRVLQPESPGDRVSVTHRLLWTAMPPEARKQTASDPNAGRAATFLWRASNRPGQYYLLGPRPVDTGGFFSIESKEFEPIIEVEDRLAFALRLNATVDRKVGTDASGKAIRKRCDVAMDLIRNEERNRDGAFRRRDHRMGLADTALRRWFSQRAEPFGMSLEHLILDSYRTQRIPRRRGKSGCLGVFDIRGVLTVTSPNRFADRLAKGIGRGKAFGCGLMLIRRPR